MPTRFGSYEPLKHAYANEGAPGFEKCWLVDPSERIPGGDVFFKMSPRIGGRGWVYWRRAWYQAFNHVWLDLPVRKLPVLGIENLLHLAQDLFATVSGAYGTIAVDGEFGSQHRLEETGVNVHGIALDEHIPGVYYANLFGRELVQFLGVDRLVACPAVINTSLSDGGWLITTAKSPLDWADASAMELKSRVREHLGVRHFFDISEPNRATTAPLYDFSQVRIGERPAVVDQPSVAEEFFPTIAAARGFIEERGLWCERLRLRVHTGTLDLSARSLGVVDNHLSAIASEETVDVPHALVLEVAAYYGEVLRQTLSGAWELDPKEPRMPALRLPDGDVEYPLIRAIKLVQDGDRLADWFEFIAKGGPRLLG